MAHPPTTHQHLLFLIDIHHSHVLNVFGHVDDVLLVGSDDPYFQLGVVGVESKRERQMSGSDGKHGQHLSTLVTVELQLGGVMDVQLIVFVVDGCWHKRDTNLVE